MVWKVDRLGRSTLTALETAQRLDKAGVRIVVTTLGADLKTSSGRLVLGVLVQLRRVPERMQDAEAAALAKAGEKARDRAKGYIGEYQKGWPPLAESTVTEKTALGYSPPDNPLLRTGDMRTLSTCPSSRDGW